MLYVYSYSHLLTIEGLSTENNNTQEKYSVFIISYSSTKNFENPRIASFFLQLNKILIIVEKLELYLKKECHMKYSSPVLRKTLPWQYFFLKKEIYIELASNFITYFKDTVS